MGEALLNFRSIARLGFASVLLWLGASMNAQAQLVDGNFNAGQTGGPTGANSSYWNLNSNTVDGSTTINSVTTYPVTVAAGSNIQTGSGTSQTLYSQTLTAGTYNITFYVEQGSNGSNGYSLSLADKVVTGNSSSVSLSGGSGFANQSSFTPITATLTIAAGTSINDTQIEFSNTNGNFSDRSIEVADFSFQKTPGPLPGAGALSYIVMGLAGFGLSWRKITAKARSLFFV